MKRKITSKLYEWKNMLNGRMPLLIYGARQVGKTFEMREFGALYYKNTIYVNFERMKESENILKQIFMQIM